MRRSAAYGIAPDSLILLSGLSSLALTVRGRAVGMAVAVALCGLILAAPRAAERACHLILRPAWGAMGPLMRCATADAIGEPGTQEHAGSHQNVDQHGALRCWRPPGSGANEHEHATWGSMRAVLAGVAVALALRANKRVAGRAGSSILCWWMGPESSRPTALLFTRHAGLEMAANTIAASRRWRPLPADQSPPPWTPLRPRYPAISCPTPPIP